MAIVMELTWDGVTPRQYDEARDKVGWESDLAKGVLWRIAIARMRRDARTQEYVVRRAQEGLSKREIIRCLKRYIAREVFTALKGVDGL